jgi:AraC-like DNA-binding protein
MAQAGKQKTITVQVKNMLCNSSLRVVREVLEEAGFSVKEIRLGEVILAFDPKKMDSDILPEILKKNGFGLVVNRELQIINKIKITVVELIHQLNNVDSIVRKSDYLVEMLGMSYQQLSKIFSKHEPLTLERYIILHKIERVKELILHDEYTLSEIAFMMDYSSVQYLSNQFRKETGYSVTEYKSRGMNLKRPLEDVGGKIENLIVNSE